MNITTGCSVPRLACGPVHGVGRMALLAFLLSLAAAPLVCGARGAERSTRDLAQADTPANSTTLGATAVSQEFVVRLSGPGFVPYTPATQAIVLQAIQEYFTSTHGPAFIRTFREGHPEPYALDNSTEHYPFVDLSGTLYDVLGSKPTADWQPDLRSLLTLQTRLLELGNWSLSTHSLRLLSLNPFPVTAVPSVDLEILIVVEAVLAVNLTNAQDSPPWVRQATAVRAAVGAAAGDVAQYIEVTGSSATLIEGSLAPEAAQKVQGRQLVRLELTLPSCGNGSSLPSPQCEEDQVGQRLQGLQQRAAAVPELAALGVAGLEVIQVRERPTPTAPLRGEEASQQLPWVPWHLDRLDQRSLPLDGKFTATALGTGVHVYLVSSGIRADHQEFKYIDGREGTRIKAGWGYKGLNSLEDCNDSFAWFGFGTFAASIIGGLNVGVARNVTIHSVRYRGSCLMDDPGWYGLEGLPAAISYVVENHASPAVVVIDAWWKKDRFDSDDDTSIEAALIEALDKCEEAGITVLVLAGATACENALAAHNATIGVISASSFDADPWGIASSCIDIWAPVTGLGVGMTGASPSGPANYKTVMNTGLWTVAGVAAQYLGLNPDATPAQVREWLKSAATPDAIVGMGPDTTSRLAFTNLTAPPGALDYRQPLPVQLPSLETGGRGSGQPAAAQGGGAGSSLPVAAVAAPIAAVAVLAAATAFVLVRRRRRKLSAASPQDPQLPAIKPLPGPEWQIPEEEIEICRRPDSSEWLLGAGSFGQVFKAIKGGVQVVAVKQLYPSCMDGPRREQFVQEIALMKYVSRDANVTQFYGACMTPNTMQLVVEFMEGGDLRAALTADSGGELSWYRGGKNIALDILRGLHFLHASHVIHRDIKSKNILLTREGRAKLADVGLAQVLEEAEVPDGAEQEGFAGTFAWAAPEVMLGEVCSEKADIYSVGVVLWEIVTQEVPLRGCLHSPEVPRQCPEGVVDAIHDCLQRDPAARPSARELYTRLLCCAPTDDSPNELSTVFPRLSAATSAGTQSPPASSTQALIGGGASSLSASSTRGEHHHGIANASTSHSGELLSGELQPQGVWLGAYSAGSGTSSGSGDGCRSAFGGPSSQRAFEASGELGRVGLTVAEEGGDGRGDSLIGQCHQGHQGEEGGEGLVALGQCNSGHQGEEGQPQGDSAAAEGGSTPEPPRVNPALLAAMAKV